MKRIIHREGVIEVLTCLFVGAGFAYQLIKYLGPLGIWIVAGAIISLITFLAKNR